MSDQDIGKKMVEETELQHFLVAYELALGQRLVLVRTGERPDFVCQRGDNSIMGVELTKIMRDPDTAQADRILKHQNQMIDATALNFIYESIAKKADKIAAGNWSTTNNILVLQLTDCRISDLQNILNCNLQDDFNSYGLTEIWIADYTELDAHGDIELFCLHPKKWWGYYQRQNPYRKPYG